MVSNKINAKTYEGKIVSTQVGLGRVIERKNAPTRTRENLYLVEMLSTGKLIWLDQINLKKV